jgi:taurine dioxygenase
MSILPDIGDAGTRAELQKALAEFQVLFFRKQKLSAAEQVAVARVFGDPDKAKAFFPRHEAQKFIEVLEARPGVNRYGTDQWHADITFAANPPTGTVLYSHIVPESGGDTVWASATAVYDSLPTLAAGVSRRARSDSQLRAQWLAAVLRGPARR